MKYLKYFPCAVCFGAGDPQATKALDSAVLFLIGVTVVVLIGLTWMVVRTVRHHQQKLTAHEAPKA